MFIDDLEQVCHQAGIDRAGYRSFPLAISSRDEEKSNRFNPETVASDLGDPGLAPVSRATTDVPAQPATPWPTAANTHRTSVLNALLEGADTQPSERRTTSLRIGLLPGAGGVGATTLAASLARFYSLRGNRVALLDSAAQSLLPLYLGAGDTAAGRCSFLGRQGNQGSISVWACGEAGRVASTSQLAARAEEAVSGAEVTIVDPGAGAAWDWLTTESVCRVSLVILAPDVRCAIAVRNIEKELAARGVKLLPFYLLNCFDPGSTLHRELESRIADFLGERLLRPSLLGSTEVSQALAEGATVIDTAPASTIARQIGRLADWLQQLYEPAPLARSAHA